MSAVGPRLVRDGSRELRFNGAVLGSVTSQRPAAPRWSEIVVYRVTDGTYLISKVGRSTIAHRPSCTRVNRRRMVALREARDEARVWRTPCVECRPEVGRVEDMDPDTILETTRYSALLGENADAAVRLLTNDREGGELPRLIRDVLRQASEADPELAKYAAAVIAGPNGLAENTTRTP